jgi:predicted ATP-dependent Lon-type protease
MAPFAMTTDTPTRQRLAFQVSVVNVDEYVEKRAGFTTDEWIDVLINSCGLDPARLVNTVGTTEREPAPVTAG